MVHKKYTFKDGKVYGPYLYETKRVDGKIVTKYLGQGTKKFSFMPFLVFAGVLIIVLLLFFFARQAFTGNVSLEIDKNYQAGEIIDGSLTLKLSQGELIPAGSRVKVMIDGLSKEFLLSDLSGLNTVSGNFYVSGSSLSGEGEGIGIIGTKRVYPTVDFDLSLITSTEVNESEVVSVDQNDTEINGEDHNETSSEGSQSENDSSQNNETEEDNSVENEDQEPSVDEETSNDGTQTNEENEGTTESETDQNANQETGEANQESSESSDSSSSDSGSESSGSSDSGSDSGGITGAVVSEFSRKVSGTVSYGNDFVYLLDPEYVAEIIEDSIEVDGEKADSSILSISQENGEVKVSTDYYVEEEGFGEDFVGDGVLSVPIDISSFGIVASNTSTLTLDIIYGDEVIFSDTQEIVVEGELNETNVTLPTSNLTFLKEIPTIRINNESFVLNLGEYFEGAEQYVFESGNGVSGNASFGMLTITADAGFSGAREGKVIALANGDSVESNSFLILVSSGDISLALSHANITINQPVQWTQEISLEEPQNFTFALPIEAENITVTALDSVDQSTDEIVSETEQNNGSIGDVNVAEETFEGNNETIDEEVESEVKEADGTGITGSVIAKMPGKQAKAKSVFKGNLKKSLRFTGFATEGDEEQPIEVTLPDNATEFVVSYYTDAPEVREEILPEKKVIHVSAPELNYTNVLTYTNLSETVQVGYEEDIRVYWVENSTYLASQPYDFDQNGYLDYIEWITPHLSNQTFEIIVITDAQHLNENRSFISNIYDEVKALDGNWSEEIVEGHYVRVTFERALGAGNDITIYPNITNGTPLIEVYQIDSSEIVATFGNISSDQYNKVYLTNLSNLSQDTFDLRIFNGSVILDHIIDPTNLTPGTRQGMVVYGVGTAQTPFYRIWNGSTWSNELTANSVGGTIEWVVTRSSPVRNEYMVLTADSGDDINVQINSSLGGTPCWHNGTVCNSVREFTATSTTANQKKGDIEYEDIAGDAIVAYSNNTNRVYFSVWNGATWTPIQDVNGTSVSNIGALSLNGTIETVNMVERPDSNEIALILSDSNDDSQVIIWNGTYWSCQSTKFSYTLGTTDIQKVDGAYESLSGDLLVVSAVSGTSVNLARKAADTCTFVTSNQSVLNSVYLDVAAQQGSNLIMISGSTGGSTDDLNAQIWNGTAIINVSAEDTAIYANDSAPNRIFSAVWAGQKHGIVVYSDASPNTVVDWLFYNKTSGGWSVPATDFTPSPLISEENNIIAYSFVDENKSFVFLKGEALDLSAKIYSAETNTWSNTEGGTFLNNSLASLEFPVMDFSWNMFVNTSTGGQSDTTAPQVTVVFPANITYSNLSLPFVFNVTLSENGVVVYSLDNGANNVTMSTIDNLNYNATNASLADGSYVFRVYANDTAGNRNDSVSVTFAVESGLNVSACRPLTASNTQYNVTSSFRGTGDCLSVTGEDIILNGNGLAITGNGSGAGINVSGILNFTIVRLNITNFSIDIFAESNGSAGVPGSNVTLINSTVGIVDADGVNRSSGDGTNGGIVRLENSDIDRITVRGGSAVGASGNGGSGGGIRLTKANLTSDIGYVDLAAGVGVADAFNGSLGLLVSNSSRLNLLNISNGTVGRINLQTNYSVGNVEFIGQVNFSRGLYLNGTYMTIRDDFIYINSTANSLLNVPAQITFSNSSAPSMRVPEIYRDGVLCGECEFAFAPENTTASFYVPGFSNYTIIDVSTGGILNNVTAENNYTHLTIDNTTSPIDSLVLYYSFDSNASTTKVYDNTRYSNDASIGQAGNGARWNSTGFLGGAYEFNGSSNYIRIQDDASTRNFSKNTNFSVALWFKSGDTAVSTTRMLVADFQATGNRGWVVQLNSSSAGVYRISIAVRAATNMGACSIASAPNDNKWHFFVGSWNTTTLTCQLDGTSAVGTVYTGNDFGNSVSPAISALNNGSTTQNFNGTLDEIMIFNTTLSSTQANNLYTNATARFYGQGTQTFDSINVSLNGNENQINVTVTEISNFNNTNLTVQIGESINGVYLYGLPYQFSSGRLTGVPINTPNNISIRILFNADSTNKFYTPILEGNLTVLGGNESVSCRDLNQANTVYTLTANVVPVSGSVCYNVTAVNVTLDGAGFALTNVTYTGIGVYSNQLNTTIKNLNISLRYSTDAIKFVGSNSSYVFNVTVMGVNQGVYLSGTFNTTINALNVSNATEGVFVDLNSSFNTIRNSHFFNNSDGVHMSGNTGTLKNNTVSSSTFLANGIGIRLTGTFGTVIDQVRITSSATNGMSITSASTAGFIINTTATLSGTNGLSLTQSHGNYLGDSNFTSNTQDGISIVQSANTTIDKAYINRNTLNGLHIAGTLLNPSLSTKVILTNINGSGTNGILIDDIRSSNFSLTNVSMPNTAPGAMDFNMSAGAEATGASFANTFLRNYSFGTGLNVSFSITNIADIMFLSSINGSGNNLSDDILLGFNFTGVRIERNSGLNRSANITFYNMPGAFTSPRIKKDGVVCSAPYCFNFTSLNAATVVFNVTGFSNYSISETAVLNSAPLDPVPVINSSRGTNFTIEDLNCFATLSDPDANAMNVSIRWYNKSILSLSVDYNNSYANGTIFNAILDDGNTTKGENWTCGMRLFDGTAFSNWVNASNLSILNWIPNVTLVSPLDANVTTNRTPTFTWASTDPDGDSLTYDLNITCRSAAATCNLDNRLITGISGTTTTLTADLKLLYDYGYYYNWTIRASDGEATGSYATPFRINVSSLVQITLPNDTINFGSLPPRGSNDTTDNSPLPFTIQNDGNVLTNITIEASNLWSAQANPNQYYQFKADNFSVENNSFNADLSTVIFTNVSAAGSPVMCLAQLNYTDVTDRAEIDLYVEVPPNEPAGVRNSTVTFTASLGE